MAKDILLVIEDYSGNFTTKQLNGIFYGNFTAMLRLWEELQATDNFQTTVKNLVFMNPNAIPMHLEYCGAGYNKTELISTTNYVLAPDIMVHAFKEAVKIFPKMLV